MIADLDDAVPASTTSVWTPELVDAAGTAGAYLSHAYDPTDGNASIAYTETGRNTLRFAHWNGASWAIENVTTGGTGIDLAYSASGQAAISFRATAGKGELKVARKIGASWTIESVDRGVGEFTSVAFDSAGNPAVAYTVSAKTTTAELEAGQA